jgi:ParB family chromosome partitioning protein
MARPGGLGKGLGALIPSGAAERVAAGAPLEGGLQELPIGAIRPNPYQPRDRFDEEGIGALADSIREVGLLQPVLVRPADGGFELIAGERRWRAARRAGLQAIPAIVRATDDRKALEQALVENLQRDDLNPLEEAAAYQQMIEDFSMTHEQVATTVGKSRAAVTNTVRLLQLPPSIQRALRDGQLSMGHSRALLGTPDRAFQEALARRTISEDLSVRAVEEAVRARNDGHEPGAGRATPTRMRPPGLLELEELLSDHLETRVKLRLGAAGKGTATIDFAGLDDLERIYRRMSDGRAPSNAASA